MRLLRHYRIDVPTVRDLDLEMSHCDGSKLAEALRCSPQVLRNMTQSRGGRVAVDWWRSGNPGRSVVLMSLPFEKTLFRPVRNVAARKVRHDSCVLELRQLFSSVKACFPVPALTTAATRRTAEGMGGAEPPAATRSAHFGASMARTASTRPSPGASTVARSAQAGGTRGESGFSGFSPAATAAAIWREGRPFVGWPGASRLFGGRCRAG